MSIFKRRLLVLLTVILTSIQSVSAQTAGVSNSGPPIGAFKNPTVDAPTDAQYLLLSANAILTNYRIATAGTNISITDGGATGNATIGITGQIGLGNGGTGASTQQGAANAVLGASSGSTGDLYYRDGSGNVVRLPIGSASQVLQVSAGLPAWGSITGAPSNAQYLTLALDGTLSAERVATAGSGISITDGGANGNATFAVDTAVVATTSNTLTMTNKTLTSPKFGTSFLLKGTSFDATVTWADWAAARALSIPETGGSAEFVMTAANQTVAGVKTFSSAPKLSTNTLTTSSGNTITLPDSTDTMVNLASTQTLTNKTLTSPIMNTSVLFKSGANSFTLGWDAPAAARAVTLKDLGVDTYLVQGVTTLTYPNGGIPYANGSAITMLSAGSSGQPLLSGGVGAPSWGTLGAAYGGTGTTTVPAKGSVLVGNAGGTAYANLTVGTDGYVLQADSASTNGVKWAAAGTGTVTSVAQSLSGLGFMSVSGSPVTTSGTLTLTASGTTGDLLYFSGASTVSKLAIGSTGNVLTVSGGVPAWGAASVQYTPSAKSADFTANSGSGYFYIVNTSGGAVTATLPDTPAAGYTVKIVCTSASNNVTITRGGTNTIQDPSQGSQTSITLSSTKGVVELIFDGTSKWYIS